MGILQICRSHALQITRRTSFSSRYSEETKQTPTSPVTYRLQSP